MGDATESTWTTLTPDNLQQPSSRPHMKEVLIVGAGPTGLILAVELLRRNVPIRLIDRRQGPSHTTRAMSIHARSLEMFQSQGIANRLEEVALAGPGNLYHFPGLTAAECPRTDFRNLPTRFNHYYKICQNDFEQVLRAHVKATYSVVPEYNTEFIGAAVLDNGISAKIRLPDDREIDQTFSYVVGADGAHSAVRETAGIAFPGRVVGKMGMIDVAAKSVGTTPTTPSADWMNYYYNDNCFICYTEMPNNLWRFYLFDKTGVLAGDTTAPRAAFQSALDDLKVPVTLLDDPSWHSAWTILNNVAERYRNGRLLICGDASHVHSPAGGQGMNGSMQDAFNLGWKLAAVWHGRASDAILDTYERERKPIGEQISAGAKATHNIIMGFSLDMDARYAITQQPGWEDHTTRMVSALSHNYRSTSLPWDGLKVLAGPQPGDRTPDCVLKANPAFRLYDLLKSPEFTVLLVGEEDKAVAVECGLTQAGLGVEVIFIGSAATDGFNIDSRCEDKKQEMRKAFAIPDGEDRIVVVRPDFYLGMVCQFKNWKAVVTYMKQWFH